LAAIRQVNPKFKDTTKEGETATEKLKRLTTVVEGLSDEELKKLEARL
jgi:hypothetical protein